jgi:hypothetical protein
MVGTVVAPVDLVRLARAYQVDGVHRGSAHPIPIACSTRQPGASDRAGHALWHEERE